MPFKQQEAWATGSGWRRTRNCARACSTAAPVKGFRCRPVACAAASPGAGVGKPPGKEPAGCFAEDAPQALWGFRRCLRHGNAAVTPVPPDDGIIRRAGERRRPR